ncbi:MAG: class E sortase [Acidimicrobiales bacterium]
MSQRTARVVAAVGRGLIGAGLVILAFVGYQLWGTGLQHSRAQSQLSSDFSDRLAAAEAARVTPTTTTTTGGGGEADGVADLTPVLGEPVARIEIPAIDVDETVVHGVRVSDLRKGPGHFETSPLPGQPGNSAIAGHRTTYGQPFHDVDRLQPGDEIVVTTLQGEFTYQVMGHPDGDGPERGYFIVPPTAVDVLDEFGDDRLTLVACHPKFSSRQRIIVTALLVDDPVDPPTEVDEVAAPPVVPVADDFGEGLDGDPDALVPAVLWGSLFGLTLAAAVAAGRMWRRWPAYALSAPLLAWFLFTSFVHLDQYLPSY